ncbi:MAG: FHA domain-containing protein [Nannocystaceae bacterium]
MNDRSTPFLLVTDPNEQSREVALDRSPQAIGRSPRVEIVLEDDAVSRRHAELERDEEGAWWVRDLGSINGTRVNGQVLADRHRLKIGDRIEIEGFALLFRLP